MAESLKHLQLFRGASKYTDLSTALTEIGKVTLLPGEPAVAFYGAEGEPVQAVLAIGGSGNTKDYFYDYAEIEAKINALDYELVRDGKKVLTYIKQENGLVSASADTLDGADITYTKGQADVYVSAATTVDAAIKALDAGLKTAKGEQKQYKLEKKTIDLDANVKEQYNLKVSTDGEKWDTASGSESINIYKDSALQSVELVSSGKTEYLEFKYIDASGATQTVDIDVSKFLAEAEFKDGFVLGDGDSGHTVSVKLDTEAESDSAKFLYFKKNGSENGAIALSGITTAIATAKSEVIGVSTDNKDANTIYGAKAFATDAVNTAKTQLIGTTGDTSGSTTIEGAKKYADAVVAAKNVTAEGDTTYINATAANNKVTVVATEKVTKAVASAETAVQDVIISNQTDHYVVVSAAKAAGTNIVTITTNEAELGDKFTAIDNALEALSGKTGDTSASTSIAGAKLYTDQKVADLAVQATGDTYVTATVGSGADNKKVTVAATQKTQDAIAAAETSLQDVTGANAIEVGTKSGNANAKTQAISLKIDNTNDNSWLSQGTNGLKVVDTLDCGTF